VSDANREQLRELASLHALGVLSKDERAELAAAIAADPELAAEVRELEDTAGALGSVAPQVDPPARLRGKVLQDAGLDVDAPGAGTGGGAAVTPFRTAAPPAAPASRAASRALPGWLAAAAALVLASGLGLWALQLRTSLEAMNARVEKAEQEMVEMRRTLGQAEERTRVLQAHNNVLFAPDTLRVDLAGQPVAPGATARAFMSRENGVVFTANALPALPADKAYQLWVIADGKPVSAGLVTPDPSGHAAQLFAMPPNLVALQAVAVTIEPAGGVPAPTGDKVLVGAIGTSAG
jgi:anti-sigma-K factor RskA